jgi:hypothetical protein
MTDGDGGEHPVIGSHPLTLGDPQTARGRDASWTLTGESEPITVPVVVFRIEGGGEPSHRAVWPADGLDGQQLDKTEPRLSGALSQRERRDSNPRPPD